MENIASSPRHPVLDGSAFPNIIDNILEHLTIDHPAALALQGTCRAWHRNIRHAVFRHIRCEVVGPVSQRGDMRITSCRFSTVPPPGGRSVHLPVETYWLYISSPLAETGPPLPQSLVAVASLIHAFDKRGPIPYMVSAQLYTLAPNLIVVRLDEVVGRDTFQLGFATDTGCYQVPTWYGSPLRHLQAHGIGSIPSGLTQSVHVDISEMAMSPLNQRIKPWLKAWIKRWYLICYPPCPCQRPDRYYHGGLLQLIALLQRYAPVTLVGMETFNLKDPGGEPQEIWEELLRTSRADLDLFRDPLAFMTHDEYEALFGRGTYRHHDGLSADGKSKCHQRHNTSPPAGFDTLRYRNTVLPAVLLIASALVAIVAIHNMS